MATIFVASGGSNTSPYETWAKAATSLQTALTAMAAGDVVVIQYNAVPTGDAEVGADTTYTVNASGSLVSASNDGGSSYTLTAMGAANWVGNSTTNRYIRLAGNDLKVYIYGLTFRCAGSTLDNITPAYSPGSHHVLDTCYLWHSGTATGAVITFGVAQSAVNLTNCTFRFGATGQTIECNGSAELYHCSVSADGSTPTTLMTGGTTLGKVRLVGCDLSLITGTLVGNIGADTHYLFDRCKLGAAVTVLATQTTNPTKASASALVLDCHSGDTHGFFGYYDAYGEVTTNSTIYKTTNTTGNRSWKIVTSANCSYRTPFECPLIDVYHTGTSEITPYVEILRDGSATAYKNNEVWATFGAKTTSGFTTATRYSDAQALAAHLAGTAGADQAAGTGTGNWTGENATAWSGQIDSGSAFTPAETGSITCKVCVGAASSTVYVDPEIRGL